MSRLGRRQPLARLLLAAALAVAGCDRDNGPPPPAAPEGGQAAPSDDSPRLPLAYERVRVLDSGLEKLSAIALDAQDRLYLAGAAGIRLHDREGRPLRAWATSAPAVGVAVDADGNVYAALATRIETFAPDGQPRAAWGTEGRERGQLGLLTALAVHGISVYAADAGNRCIHRFALNGDFIGEIGRRDREAGLVGIVCPSPFLDVAVDPGGDLVVPNPGRQRVERYSPNGELLGHWGEAGHKPHQFSGCCNPTNVALGPQGRVATGEKIPPRVKVHSAQGKLLARIGPEHFSPEAKGLDLAFDSQGTLYVVDPPSGTVRLFAPKEPES